MQRNTWGRRLGRSRRTSAMRWNWSGVANSGDRNRGQGNDSIGIRSPGLISGCELVNLVDLKFVKSENSNNQAKSYAPPKCCRK